MTTPKVGKVTKAEMLDYMLRKKKFRDSPYITELPGVEVEEAIITLIQLADACERLVEAAKEICKTTEVESSTWAPESFETWKVLVSTERFHRLHAALAEVGEAGEIEKEKT